MFRNIPWASKRVWITVESHGKVSEKSGNFENDIEWQPWQRMKEEGFKFLPLAPLDTRFILNTGK